jgi:prepilin-type processing-associated H-X9-DG protein
MIALTFEVDDLHLGAVAERVVPLASKRHEEMLTLGFADGHAKRLSFNRLGSVEMELKKAPSKGSSN